MAIDRIILTDRIDERLQALGLSDRKASLNAVGKPDLIRDIRRGKEIGSDRLAKLAAALETTVGFLCGEGEASAPAALAIPAKADMSRDIPVFGTAIGADASFWGEHDGDVAIEQTDLSTSEVIDYFRRPPRMEGRKDVYGLYVAGDSMSPAYDSGEGILVDPKRSPAINDYVVVYLRDRSDEFAAAALIKRLVKRSATFVELRQYNPPATFRLEMRQVREMHRVVPWDEAVGF